MSLVSKYPIPSQVYESITNLLLRILTHSFSRDTAQHILDELLSPTEKIVLAKRLAIIILLRRGYKYESIQEILHVSRPTIAAISTQLKHGKQGLTQFADSVLHDQELAKFWQKTLDIILQEFSKGKGSGLWSYLRSEINKKPARSSIV